MKKLVICYAAISYFGLALGQAPQLVPGWPYYIIPDGFTYSTPVFEFPQNPLGNAVYYPSHDFIVHKFHFDATHFQGWPLVTDSVAFRYPSPIVVDIDHDGLSEVVINGFRRDYYHNYLFVIDNDGSVMSGFPVLLEMTPFSLHVADFDNDGEYEIMSYTVEDDKVHCFDRFGNYKPGWPIQGGEGLFGNNSLGGGGAVGDFDLDGCNEYVLMGPYHIYAYRYDGTIQPGFPIVVHDSTNWCFTNGWVWPPILADLDNDGYLEMVVSGENWCEDLPPQINSFISIYEHDGSLKAGWPRYYNNQLIRHAPVPCDINGDDILELGFQATYLNFIDMDGNPLPGWPAPVIDPRGRSVFSYSEFMAVDIDGDRDNEIFLDSGSLYADSMGHDSLYYGMHGFIYGFDHLGQYLPGFPLMVGGETFSRPPNFGYDPVSHRLYMAIYAGVSNTFRHEQDSGKIEVYLFPDSTGPPDQWPMLSHDNLMTRNYNFVDRVVSVYDEEEEILPRTPILRQNYPNPFNTSTLIEFTLPEEGHFTLSIYDILGRKVADLYDGTFPAGSYRHKLDMDVPSGVYFYTLRTEKTRITRKMTLLK